MENKECTEIFSKYLRISGLEQFKLERLLPEHSRVVEGFLLAMRSWVDGAKLFPNNNQMDPIYVDLSSDLSLGATAFIHENKGFISVNIGTVLLIKEIFFRLLSHPEVLPLIGNPGIENASLVADTSKLYNSRIYFEKNEDEETKPVDNVRQGYALLLSVIALEFLIMHEYGHHRHGHLLFTESEGYMAEISEFSKPGISLFRTEKDKVLLQMLEFDADAYATSQSLCGLFDKIQNRSQVYLDFLGEDRFEEKMLPLWCFSIFSIFRIFDDGQFKAEDLIRKSHPPHRVRTFTIFNIVEQYFLNEVNNKALWNLFESDIAANSMDEVEDAFALISGQERPNLPHGVDSLLKQETMNHVFVVITKWQEVRAKLLPFSRGINLPDHRVSTEH
jgi:hypothetical protein